MSTSATGGRYPPGDVAAHYLARDYASFRQMLLDRITANLPEWAERHEADLGVALVEALAYAGDRLSYLQDVVATEAYLETAHSRGSVARHVRLVDYRLHDGCNARTWLHFDVRRKMTLPAGTPVGSMSPAEAGLSSDDTLGKTVIFETMTTEVLHPFHNEMNILAWAPHGAYLAAIQPPPSVGDILMLQDPSGNSVPVRIAMPPFPGPQRPEGSIIEVRWAPTEGPIPVPERASGWTALGNNVLADHGLTLTGLAATKESQRRYRLELGAGPITASEPVPPNHRMASPVALLQQDPRRALAQVRLSGPDGTWWSAQDLIGADRFAQAFKVEVESGEIALLMGDGVNGKVPLAGASYSATARIGSGSTGNVARGTLVHPIDAPDGVRRVWNPVPAVGGTDPEPLPAARMLAPSAFRAGHQRCVTLDDYASVAAGHEEVRAAVARRRGRPPLGEIVVYIDPVDRLSPRPELCESVASQLRPLQTISDRVFVRLAEYAFLNITIHVTAAGATTTVESIVDAVAPKTASPGAILSPGGLGFGADVRPVDIAVTIGRLPGVISAHVISLQRVGTKLAAGPPSVVGVASHEIARIDNDSLRPEHGLLNVTLEAER